MTELRARGLSSVRPGETREFIQALRDENARLRALLTPKRCSSGQLYSEGAQGTPSGTRRARDKLISVLACNKGVFATLFPSLAPPRNAKVGRAGLMKAARMGC